MNSWSILALVLFVATTDQETIKLDHALIAIGLVQCVIFVLQLVVFGFQAWKLHQTVKASTQQSADMQRSIDEARRAANAMEKSATAATTASENVVVVTKRAAQQMRAYLSVRINSGGYQDPAKNVRFAVSPMLINTGQTPAYKVGYVAKAAILAFPLPNDFTFPALSQPTRVFGLLAPQHHMIMNAFVEGPFFADAEAEVIKRGRGRRVYIWGTVIYEDVTGEQRYTNFAHNIFWLATQGDPIWGNYADRHSDAN